MYVTSVTINNIRGFGSSGPGDQVSFLRADGTLAGWTVLAGRNGTGKTTLLRAIAIAVVGPALARILQQHFSRWINDAADDADVGVGLQASSGDSFVAIKRPHAPFAVALGWSRLGHSRDAGMTPVLTLPDAGQSLIPKLDAAGPWAENTRGWFLAGYGPFRRLTGHASDAQRLMVGPRRVARLVSLFREDASLIESVQWLKDVYTRRLEKRPGAKDLEESVLRLLDDGLLPEGMKIDHFDSDGLWVERGTVKLPLDELSDGYRTMAALVLDLVRHLFDEFGEFKLEKRDGRWVAPYEGVVLIDEIDVHLHVSWQQRVGFWLKEHFPAIQFIVTTHSPFICQAADPGGLIRLPSPGEGRLPEHITGDAFQAVVNGSADDAVLTHLFGLERPYSQRSELMRQRVAELEVKELRSKLTAKEKKELKELRAQLPKTGSALVEQTLRKIKADP